MFLLASALEKKNPIRREYWEKKEQSSGDAKKKPTNFKSDVIVREFMVLYNQLLAMNAKEMKIPYTYRTQEEEYISGLITDLDIKLDDATKKILVLVLNAIHTQEIHQEDLVTYIINILCINSTLMI